MANQLMQIQHIVHLMLENRSFDHMLGVLYDKENPPAGNQPFDGLTGEEFNPSYPSDKPFRVFDIGNLPSEQRYCMLGTDPGEGFHNYNNQLYGRSNPSNKDSPTNLGFIKNFALKIDSDKKKKDVVRAWTRSTNIMGYYTPTLLPVLSTLASAYAVCDRWFSSIPGHTWPNRAFAAAATSQGILDNPKTPGWLTAPTIFNRLSTEFRLRPGLEWAIFYPVGGHSHSRTNFAAIQSANFDGHFGDMDDFSHRVANGRLPAYSFIEPGFGAGENSQHPDYDVAQGEQLIWSIYNTLRTNLEIWNSTLFIITYDEHGGLYDHVGPPRTATPPDDKIGQYGFDFSRFGVRVPAVLVSPLISMGTVFRAANGTIDHTSVLQTIFERWGGPTPHYLSNRDKAAPSLSDVLTLSAPRTDNLLANVTPPAPCLTCSDNETPSALELLHAEQVAQLPVPDSSGYVDIDRRPLPTTAQGIRAFVAQRSAAWQAFQKTVEESLPSSQ